MVVTKKFIRCHFDGTEWIPLCKYYRFNLAQFNSPQRKYCVRTFICLSYSHVIQQIHIFSSLVSFILEKFF